MPVRPEQVVEIAVDGVQRSTRYPGGVALRFARVVRYRDDKTADEADTIETVRAPLSRLVRGSAWRGPTSPARDGAEAPPSDGHGGLSTAARRSSHAPTDPGRCER